MGVGVSSLRLRKAVVLRAYNLRDGDQTLEEQFRKYAFRGDDGRLWIKLSDIKNGLSFTELSWADDMMKRVLGDSVNSDLVFSEFVEFLETGQEPSSLRGSSSLSALPSSSSSSSGEEMGMGSRSMSSIDQHKSKLSSTASPNKTPAPGRPTRPGLPPQPPRSSSSPSENDMNANVDRALSFAKAPEDDDDAVTTTTTRSSTALTVLPNALGASPSSSVWRKRELVRQERTVLYTTIDANGTLQELVEKETSETEVLHMESRDTGEFAHRETTVYEQRETFNDEVVNEQHGEEEYVHLRSLEDEYEYMNSSGAVPGRGGGANDPQSEAPPISPRAHNEEYEGGGGGGGGGGAGGEEEEGDGRGFLDPSLAHYPGAEGGEQLDEETLAFLQMQELQRQYEEYQRAQAESGEAGGPVEGEYDDEDDEAGYPVDMPRSWTEPHTQTQTQTQYEPEPVEQEAEGPASQQQSLADID